MFYHIISQDLLFPQPLSSALVRSLATFPRRAMARNLSTTPMCHGAMPWPGEFPNAEDGEVEGVLKLALLAIDENNYYVIYR